MEEDTNLEPSVVDTGEAKQWLFANFLLPIWMKQAQNIGQSPT